MARHRRNSLLLPPSFSWRAGCAGCGYGLHADRGALLSLDRNPQRQRGIHPIPSFFYFLRRLSVLPDQIFTICSIIRRWSVSWRGALFVQIPLKKACFFE